MTSTSNYKTEQGEKNVLSLYDKVLASWPVPHEEQRIDTRHGETFVITSGTAGAPPLLLLHGSCSNAVSWIGDVPAYARSHRVYAVDIPGEPGRSSPNRPSWESPAFAEWLGDLLDGLGITSTSLLGISQGGWTALRFATIAPERVAKLMLLAPGGVVPAKASFLLRAIPLSMMGRWGGERINRITFGNTPIHPQAVEFMNVIMTHFRPRIGSQVLFSDEELRRLTMPVLLLVGERDALFPSRKTLERLAALLPALDGRLLPGAGHVLYGLTGEIGAFLSRDTIQG